MTTNTEIFTKVKELIEGYKQNNEAALIHDGIHIVVNSDYEYDCTIYFGDSPDLRSYNCQCDINLMFCVEREQHDDVGYYATSKLQVRFYNNNRNVELEHVKKNLMHTKAALDIMTLLANELPASYETRGDTHAEREIVQQRKQTAQYVKVNVVTKQNTFHMRVGASKVLAAVPTGHLAGEYETRRFDKVFKVILTAEHTVLLRTA